MNLLITGAFPCSPDQIGQIEGLGYSVTYVKDETVPLSKQGIALSEIEGVICNSLFLKNPIEGFSHLKFIQLTSAGYDRVPLEEIQKRNIKICNARGVYSVPMAEFALCGVLQLYKQSPFFYENQKSHVWEKRRDLLELAGRTVCIVGCGSVGQECAKRFGAFGCRVIGIDLAPFSQESFSAVYGLEEMDQWLPMCDVVVLTLPLTPQTYHLFDGGRLSRFKEGCVLVNIARGPVVEEEALLEKLREGPLGGAVLDVFEEEPLDRDSPLWDAKHVILTPHNSFIGEGNRRRLWDVVYRNLKEYQGG